MLQLSPKLIPKMVLFFCIIFFAGWKYSFSDTSQSWFKNSATFALSSIWGLKLDQETRNLDITFSNPYHKCIGGGFVYYLPKNFYFSAVYKRVHVEIQDIIYNENRFQLQAGWETQVAKNLEFDIYFRTEIREFEEEFQEDHLRFRFQLRLKTELHIGKLRLKPFIANETFGKTKIFTVQKNRFFIGTMIPLSENVGFRIAYLWLATRGVESIHIIHSGFQLNF
jgi:hypothetical protein